MVFQGSLYTMEGSLSDIDRAIIRIVIDRIRKRIDQREKAYEQFGKLHHYQRHIDELRRRLKYLRKQSKPKVLAGLIKLHPILKILTPPKSSGHYASYISFLEELNTWILKSYQDV